LGRSREPYAWLLFSGGGMLAALALPALALLFLVAMPLGWVAAPSHADLLKLVSHPVSRLILFALISLSFFHWAHRFRFTLYDGLQLAHLWGMIALICYGGAALGCALAGWVLLTLP
jgi:fumarate reductase subunit D